MLFKIKEVNSVQKGVSLSNATATSLGIFFGDVVQVRQSDKVVQMVALEANLPEGFVGFSKSIIASHGLNSSQSIEIKKAKDAPSTKYIFKKLRGERLSEKEFFSIVKDINSESLSEAAIAYFVSGVASNGLTDQETYYLTKAMAYSGDRMKWGTKIVGDKHCVGGIPGNRTTPIVVAICAAAGVTMPKTSSRAITSAAGTADSIEVLADVALPTSRLKEIVKSTGACLAWGGSLGLAPADDLLIHVERQLNLDPTPQIVASILSKKLAAGSSHILIDIPVGKNAKVSTKEGKILDEMFKRIGFKFGLKIQTILTDGTKPIGQGVGPVLEIIDVLAVLGQTRKILDLEEKSIFLAGQLLELTQKAKEGKGEEMARALLYSGAALKKFNEVLSAQGMVKNPNLTPGPLSYVVKAKKSGKLMWKNQEINNLAKALGCPEKKRAGVFLNLPQSTKVGVGDSILTLYAQDKFSMDEGLLFLKTKTIFEII